MAKFLTLAQLQKEFGITMRSLKELMQRDIYEPVKSIADQAKAIADSVRRDADAGEFKGDPGETGPRGQAGAQGEPGNPGFSPTVAVSEVTGGYRVTITDESGAHDFIVYDGADGQDGQDGQDGHTPVITAVRFQGQPRLIIFADGQQIGYVLDGAKGNPGQDGQDGAPGADGEDGYSPTVSVEEITGGHRVTITDAEGSHAFDVMDGQGGGEGTVFSVNGKTGTVVLDAGDVGARADTWVPTAAQVGARADTWMPTAAQVGALPDTTAIPTSLAQLSGDSTHRVVTDSEKSGWNGKQNAISDLATIRSEAANGQTAYELLDGVETLLADI